jgi:hypothetical protein
LSDLSSVCGTPHRKVRKIRAGLAKSGALIYSVPAQGGRPALIGAGTIINPIVKIVTTVVILGAIYLFFVRPILDTTEEVASKTTTQIRQSQAESAARAEAIDLDAAESRAGSYVSSLQGSWPAAARAVQSCIRDAKGNVNAMERCAEFGQTVTHTLQSDYNFATSYADSLDSQGSSAEADRVRDCVKDAGFKVAAMERCRALADDLLFG